MSAAGDFFGSIDPDRLVLAAMVVVAALSMVFGCLMAACIWALRGLHKDRATIQEPDPFFAPGSHNGLRVGPIPARTRSSETSRPGPIHNQGN